MCVWDWWYFFKKFPQSPGPDGLPIGKADSFPSGMIGSCKNSQKNFAGNYGGIFCGIHGKILGACVGILGKGQLISKCLLGVIVSTKKPTKFL